MGETSHPTIVVAESFDEWAIERLRAVGAVTILPTCDEAALRTALHDCQAVLVRTYARLTSDLLDAAPRLLVIGRGGVGLDNIDVAAARERGIQVVHTPAAATDAVADLTVGLMLGLLRGISWNDRLVRESSFAEGRRSPPSVELGGLTLGVIGMGRIGRAVARRCRNGFGMSVLYHDIVDPGWLDFSAEPVELERLLRDADVVSLHVPLDASTRHLIHEVTLRQFRRGAFLINTSRGAVVDCEALAKRLVDGALGGAALDVFDPEPLPADHPLMQAPRTLFTPHIGARTYAGLARMNDVVEDVIRVLRGQAPLYPAWT